MISLALSIIFSTFYKQHGRLDLQIAEEAMSSMKEYAWSNVVSSAM